MNTINIYTDKNHMEILEICRIINNTIVVKSLDGKAGIATLNNHKMIAHLGRYKTSYWNDTKYIIQVSEDNTIRIYDVINEKLIVDNKKIIGNKNINEDSYITLNDKENNKLSIFGFALYEKNPDLCNEQFDTVDLLYSSGVVNYLVVSKNGKKGLVNPLRGYVSNIIYDEIEKTNEFIILRSANEEYFISRKFNDKIVGPFDKVNIHDGNNYYSSQFIYCKKDNHTIVYDTCDITNPLLNQECDDADNIYANNEYYLFKIFKNGQCGITEVYNKYIKPINKDVEYIHKEVNIIDPIYDEIKYADKVYYTKKNNKYGLFMGTSHNGMVLMPHYDDIKYLGNNLYALYEGEEFSFGFMNATTAFKPFFENCHNLTKTASGYIFEKDSKYGYIGMYVAGNLYENINDLGNNFCITTKNGKKGLLYLGRRIIDPIYDNIEIELKDNELVGKTLICILKSDDKFTLKIASKVLEGNDNFEFNYVDEYDEVSILDDIIIATKENITSYINFEGNVISSNNNQRKRN